MTDGEQASLDVYREMNRYADRHEDYPSAAVYEQPRRTLNEGWRKFHATSECGRGKVAYVEETSTRPVGDKYEYRLRCWQCGHRVDETDILFVGGEWYNREGILAYGRTIDSLFIPPERVLDLGPDPDEDALLHALELSRIEQEAGPSVGGPIREDSWRECEDCGHRVPLRYDRRCRMCYQGEWTDQMQESVNAYERKVREWHNNSYVHRLEQHVDPFSIKGRAFPGKILWRRHQQESVPQLVEVTQCLQDDRDDHWEYVLTDMTHTRQWRYHEDDLTDCFWDTGLRNDEVKPVMDDRIREVFQRVCEHSYHVVHDRDTGEPTGEQCIHCRKRRDL